jgi:hypothetical protein
MSGVSLKIESKNGARAIDYSAMKGITDLRTTVLIR